MGTFGDIAPRKNRGPLARPFNGRAKRANRRARFFTEGFTSHGRKLLILISLQLRSATRNARNISAVMHVFAAFGASISARVHIGQIEMDATVSNARLSVIGNLSRGLSSSPFGNGPKGKKQSFKPAITKRIKQGN